MTATALSDRYAANQNSVLSCYARITEVVRRHARTTAIANSELLDGFGEGQVPRWTGRSPRKPPLAPLGLFC